MAVVLTRPRQETQHWAALLREHGVESIWLPLLAIAPAPDPAALRQAADHATDYGAVMFVSVNAVQGFLACDPRFGEARAWAPGPATRDALVAGGVAAQRIDAPAADAAQFDSEHLWRQVRGQLRAGDRLLLVRGGGEDGRSAGREWLAQQLAAEGVVADTVVAYVRQCPSWTVEQQAQARRAAADGSLWLFSSSQAVAHLARLMPGQDWSRSRALATHPRIAQAVRSVGFGVVHESRPGLADVLASIESAG